MSRNQDANANEQKQTISKMETIETMSNNKQGSIEFLWDELKPFLAANYTVDESVKILSILEQAKAMHKEEHRET